MSQTPFRGNTGTTRRRQPATTTRPAKKWGLLAAGAGLAGLLVGAFLGARIAALTTSPPTGPTAPPPVGASFPTDADRYLNQVTVGLIAQDWLAKTNGWRCTTESQTDQFDTGSKRTTCYHPADFGARVNIMHDQDTQVRTIEAVCDHPVGTALCQDLFLTTAVLSLKGQNSLRTQAEEWIRQNTDHDATIIIDTHRLHTDLNRHTLTIVPAE